MQRCATKAVPRLEVGRAVAQQQRHDRGGRRLRRVLQHGAAVGVRRVDARSDSQAPRRLLHIAAGCRGEQLSPGVLRGHWVRPLHGVLLRVPEVGGRAAVLRRQAHPAVADIALSSRQRAPRRRSAAPQVAH